jgi:hypothetical protein
MRRHGGHPCPFFEVRAHIAGLENKTCRLLGAARGKHFMRVAIPVNGSFRKSPVSPK